MSAILEVTDIHKRFGGIAALDGVGLSIDRPGIYGLIGPNGAGKTTLFDVVTGREDADQGSIRFQGREILGRPPYRLTALGLARTFQECRVFPEETCLDNLLFSVQPKGIGQTLVQMTTRASDRRRRYEIRARELLAMVNLDGHARHPASELSFGQRRLLECISAFISAPRLLLLDEPASGVNPSLLVTLGDFIARVHAETGTAFLIIEHNMEFIMGLADRIIVMHEGRVLETSTPDAIQASPRVLEAYLG